VKCKFPGRPRNGYISLSGSTYYYGATARYTCATGYTLQGPNTRVCQQNERWSNALPICQSKYSRSRLNPGIPGSTQDSRFDYGRSVVFTCQTGYRLSGQAILRCGSTGKWSHAAPSCQIVTCPTIQTPLNGAVSVSTRSYQGVASFSCESGYVIEGSPNRTCQASAQWSGTQPICIPPTHGSIQPVSSGKVANGTVARFSCQTGYNIQGSSNRTCTGNAAVGSWTGTQPLCQPVNCGDPGTPINGIKEGVIHTLNSKVQFKCQPGYMLTGPTELTCRSSGEWNGSKPSCSGTFVYTVYGLILHVTVKLIASTYQ
ncbi:hypothetical protein CAPTEDRAFT_103334, partial [Capitella teleta]